MTHQYAKPVRKKLRKLVGLAEVCGHPEIYAQNIFLLK
jgi:hypothetical protein